jgi:hypothetical protein
MDRAEILDKLSNGTITAEDAAQLLHSIKPPTSGAASPSRKANLSGRHLRIRVSNLDTGRDRVNVNLPLTLVETALKLGACYESKIGNINAAEIFEMIESGTQGRLIDVEDWEDGERVEIFVE